MTISQQETEVQEEPQSKDDYYFLRLMLFIVLVLSIMLLIFYFGLFLPTVEEIYNKYPCLCLTGENFEWRVIFIS